MQACGSATAIFGTWIKRSTAFGLLVYLNTSFFTNSDLLKTIFIATALSLLMRIAQLTSFTQCEFIECDWKANS